MSSETKAFYRPRHQEQDPVVVELIINVPYADYEIVRIKQSLEPEAILAGNVKIVIERSSSDPLKKGFRVDTHVIHTIKIIDDLARFALEKELAIEFIIIDLSSSGPIDDRRKSQVKPPAVT